MSAHTEDAFHPGRANVLLLACLRNHDEVPTILGSLRHARLSALERGLLECPTLPILLDESYDEVGAAGAVSTPPEVATLWGGEGGLRIRYGPAYTPLERADGDYRAAYDRLRGELERVAVDMTLEAGRFWSSTAARPPA